MMFRGMMDLLENDDQVAAVIAHEMSHAILEHAVSIMYRDVFIVLSITAEIFIFSCKSVEHLGKFSPCNMNEA